MDQHKKPSSLVAAVIPSYKVKKHILGVIADLDKYVDLIFVIDDKCPDKSGKFVEGNCTNPKVKVIYNAINLGVGGATMEGYKAAFEANAEVIIKVDGDGQMDTTYIPNLTKPILNERADYTKGNRFFFLTELKAMPKIRLFGNSVLSMISKAVSGYWNITDPTNGFTAISRDILNYLPLDKIDKRFFFESDMLFRLATCRAVVMDIPMHAKYGDEVSNLNIWKTAIIFPLKFTKRVFKRLFYTYILRDFNIGTLHLLLGTALFVFGVTFGAIAWIKSSLSGNYASTGTVMISVLPIILGFQMLLSFISYDIQNQPSSPIKKYNNI